MRVRDNLSNSPHTVLLLPMVVPSALTSMNVMMTQCHTQPTPVVLTPMVLFTALVTPVLP